MSTEALQAPEISGPWDRPFTGVDNLFRVIVTQACEKKLFTISISEIIENNAITG